MSKIRTLFVCHTPFQLITAILIKKARYDLEEADIIITDEFIDAPEISARCAAGGLFHEVYLARIRGINLAVAAIFPNYYLKKAGIKFEHPYSLILTPGLYNDFDDAVFYMNREAEIILIDEGYSSYTSQTLDAVDSFSTSHLIARKVSKLLLRRKYIEERAKKIYLYDPDLCVRSVPYKITKLLPDDFVMDDKIRQLIYDVFNTKKALSEYDKPVIFLEESFASDFAENDDIPMIKAIANIVGQDSMMIKLHPRDKTNRFEELGYKTNSSFGVPWEAIALFLNDTRKIVLLSYSSGAVLNYRFICDKKFSVILLYKLWPDFGRMDKEKEMWLTKFAQKYGDNTFVPETMNELETILLRTE